MCSWQFSTLIIFVTSYYLYEMDRQIDDNYSLGLALWFTPVPYSPFLLSLPPLPSASPHPHFFPPLPSFSSSPLSLLSPPSSPLLPLSFSPLSLLSLSPSSYSLLTTPFPSSPPPVMGFLLVPSNLLLDFLLCSRHVQLQTWRKMVCPWSFFCQ